MEAFLSAYRLTEGRLPSTTGRVDTVEELSDRYGGTVFNEGLYRIHDAVWATTCDGLVADAYPKHANRIRTFGSDWLGRQFAVDLRPDSNGQVLMFEIGTGLVLQIPCHWKSFHDEVLISQPDAALATEFFQEWRQADSEPLRTDECAAYETPLFLGGKDEIGNLHRSDLDVYWTIVGQLRVATHSES